jgi:glycerol uptake facilitator-like aquaporin
VFIGAGAAAVVGDGVGLPGIAAVAFAHGLAIMAFAFAYDPVSGGHMNPAVTVGVLAAGAMDTSAAIATSLANSSAASSARCCCGLFWAAARRASVCLHSRTASLSAVWKNAWSYRRAPAITVARGRLYDRGSTCRFLGEGIAQHGGCGPCWQSRAAGERREISFLFS